MFLRHLVRSVRYFHFSNRKRYQGAQMKPHILAFFYGGPDQIIPLQTGLAALLAVALMFWNKLLVAFHRLVGRFKGKPEAIAPADAAVPANGEQSREQP
jgi:hypothetical protein